MREQRRFVTPVGTPTYLHYAEDGGVEQNPGVWYDGLAEGI